MTEYFWYIYISNLLLLQFQDYRRGKIIIIGVSNIIKVYLLVLLQYIIVIYD